MHAQLTSAKGVLGRMLDELVRPADELTPPLSAAAFSIAGNSKILEGKRVAPDMISASSGVINFYEAAQLSDPIVRLSELEHSSLLGGTISDLLGGAIVRSKALGDVLDSVALSASWGNDGPALQLAQVAKLISARSELMSERAVFFAEVGGFDTHSDVSSVLNEKLTSIDGAIRSFREEMMAQEIWEDVVLLTVSEFGRTLTSNGAGTDHGWGTLSRRNPPAHQSSSPDLSTYRFRSSSLPSSPPDHAGGHHLVLGGAVKGGQVHGVYPTDLTSSSDLNVGRGRVRVMPTLGARSWCTLHLVQAHGALT